MVENPPGPAPPDTYAPRVCIEMRLPPQLMLDAAERAIAEDPQNASAGRVVIERRLGLEPSSAFGALMTGKRWNARAPSRWGSLDPREDRVLSEDLEAVRQFGAGIRLPRRGGNPNFKERPQ